jgi:helicase
MKISEWLLYALGEISLILGRKDAYSRASRIKLRVVHGVKEELLKLINLKGVGRVRARILFANNIRSITDLKKVEAEKLARMLKSIRIAKKLKEQVGQKIEKINKLAEKDGQVTLGDF